MIDSDWVRNKLVTTNSNIVCLLLGKDTSCSDSFLNLFSFSIKVWDLEHEKCIKTYKGTRRPMSSI